VPIESGLFYDWRVHGIERAGESVDSLFVNPLFEEGVHCCS
jgi:hypothetical protein